jgi:hypothetical protein
VPSRRYTLTAKEPQARIIMLNGAPLRLSSDETLPPLEAEKAPSGTLRLPPASITFLEIRAE